MVEVQINGEGRRTLKYALLTGVVWGIIIGMVIGVNFNCVGCVRAGENQCNQFICDNYDVGFCHNDSVVFADPNLDSVDDFGIPIG